MYVICHLFSCYPTGKHADTQILEMKTTAAILHHMTDKIHKILWQKDYIILITDS